ncbi:MAG TPA: hypothetical protein VJB59_04785 [Bdellovibrionota bacterium]|nr:hypothetical protein [Bdellovibrionota bacterium]
MKTRITVVLGALLITSLAAHSSFAAKKPVNLERKLNNLAAEALSADLRKQITRTEEGICGAEGPSYIVDIQVRRTEKEFDQKTGELKLTSRWETVKTYGITELLLATQGAPVLMDSENCME